ncbi:MAG: type II secretion system F family protein [Campylobacterota bacterium]|nr:type II secretion system F family protein [Campylobacterota bacterium]
MKFFQILYRHGRHKTTIVLEATNKLDAMHAFQKRELGVFVSSKEVAEPLSIKINKLIEKHNDPIKKKRAPIEPYVALLRQLAVMLDAGMPINLCLDEVVESTENPMLMSIMISVQEDIESGISFTDAVKPFKFQLGNLSVSMIYLGEQTGTLAESITKLADILEAIHDNRMKLKKATRYPMITIFAMMIAFSVVITFVVPQFESMFTQMNTELPFPTKLLLWAEYAMSHYGPYIIIFAIASIMIYSYMYKKHEHIALKSDQFLLKIYIIGDITKYAMLGRFIYIFNVLIHAGIPIVDSLKAAVGVVDNRYIRQQFSIITEAIEEGRSLHSGFESSGMFERMILQMLKAGEASGSINMMLDKVTKYYNDKYDSIIDNVSTMIEPILIAAIAGFVLVLALGIFLPMWSMADAMGL